jgi:hypothetical protein
MDYRQVFGVLAVVIVVLSVVPYLRDCLLHRTRPARSTWILLTLLLLISLVLQGELESGWAMASTVGEFVACFTIMLYSFKFGVGGTTRLDKICYLLWSITVVSWIILDKPLIALHISIIADIIAMVPTYKKSWQDPESESMNVFIGGAIASAFSIVAAAELRYVTILFPLYFLLSNMSIVLVLAWSGSAKSNDMIKK